MPKLLKKYGCMCFCGAIFILGFALFGFYIGTGRFLEVPKFIVLDFRLSGLDESLITMRVNTESNFTIETRNRGKKMHIYYKDFYFSIQWKNVNLGHGRVAGFDQSSKNTSYIKGSLRSSPATEELNVRDQAQLTDALDGGRIALSIDIDVRTKWKDISGLKSDEFDAKVKCKSDINPHIATGSQLLYQDCQVLDFKCLQSC